jgi:hypothetical protein
MRPFNLLGLLDTTSQFLLTDNKTGGGYVDYNIHVVEDHTLGSGATDAYRDHAFSYMHLSPEDYEIFFKLHIQVIARALREFKDKPRYTYDEIVIITNFYPKPDDYTVAVEAFIRPPSKMICFYAKTCVTECGSSSYSREPPCDFVSACETHYQKYGCPMCYAKYRVIKSLKKDGKINK